MKKFISLITIFAFVVNSCLFVDEAFAAKGKKGKGASSAQVLQPVSNTGEKVLYGSVLNPVDDTANILLPKSILGKIRKIGPG